jgi:hypothetical protein
MRVQFFGDTKLMLEVQRKKTKIRRLWKSKQPLETIRINADRFNAKRKNDQQRISKHLTHRVQTMQHTLD